MEKKTAKRPVSRKKATPPATGRQEFTTDMEGERHRKKAPALSSGKPSKDQSEAV